jgi:hypothetical protein
LSCLLSVVASPLASLLPVACQIRPKNAHADARLLLFCIHVQRLCAC